mmetsp:Transcript_83675/g.223806  ORF Transcript_83675/g.223806 Transcript_83675/m.223806 type:complete len:400 (+) Transcript_83675:60-1259(+)
MLLLRKRLHELPSCCEPVVSLAGGDGDQIDDAAAVELAHQLKQNTGFSGVIDLSGNAITEASVPALVGSMTHLPLTGLVLRDNPVRNRAGTELRRLLECGTLRTLDIRGTKMTDDGVAQVCLGARKNPHLRHLLLAEVGHDGLRCLLDAVSRLPVLETVHVTIRDVPNLHRDRPTTTDGDFDVSEYTAKKPEKEDEEEDDEELAAQKAQAAAEAAARRARMVEGDFDSDEEDGTAEPKGTPALQSLLAEVVHTVECTVTLKNFEILGAQEVKAAEEDVTRILNERAGREQQEKSAAEQTGVSTCGASLDAQVEELAKATEARRAQSTSFLKDADLEDKSTRFIGVRPYFNRRLVGLLDDALYQCQAHKMKGNAAVQTWQGEMAFVAMHLRRAIEAGRAV